MAGPADASAWPFLVVLSSAHEEARMYGLGVVVGDGTQVMTARHVAERADVALAPGGRRLASVRFDLEPNSPEPGAIGTLVDIAGDGLRSAAVSPGVVGAPCAIASVDDQRPFVTAREGQIGEPTADGRFRVAIERSLPEYETASGSPVVVDGAVVGLVGPTAGTGYVDAFTFTLPAAPATGPPLARSARNALSLAEAMLRSSERTPDHVATAAMLGALAEAAAAGTLADGAQIAGLVRERHGDLDPQEVVDQASRAAGLRPYNELEAATLGDEQLAASDVQVVLHSAQGIAASVGAGEVHMRHVLAWSLASDPVQPLPAALDALAVTLPELRAHVLAAVRETVPEESIERWTALLGDGGATARPAAAYDLAGGFSADAVDPTTGIPLERDDLGVRAYVAMLAAVIADEKTPMPLSIGLFGEWGSGKSTFMGLLRGQVRTLAESGSPRYLRHIRQIGFNAWNYADTNLWASLGQEIFDQLAGRANPEPAQREALQTELSERLQTRKELEDATQQAQAETARLHAALDVAARRNATSARKLARAAAASPELAKAWRQLGIDDEAERGRLLAGELRGAPTESDALRRMLARAGWRAIAVAVALVAAAAAVALLFGEWIAGGGLAALGSVLAAALAVATRARSGLAHLRRAATQIETELVAGELAALRDAEASQQVLQAQLDEVVGRVGELGRELAELAPGRRLYSFVAERAGGDDYRRHLGLISTVRRDFEQLNALMKEWRTRAATDDDAPRPIDRIVLYIDDLDRCSPRQVVDVLQAVHLLLALDLFVVVVGVDPRWLLRSLQSQYDELLTDSEREAGEDAWHASPQDYLEKIFNIPLALPRMNSDSFKRLLGSIAREGIDGSEPEREAPPPADAGSVAAAAPAGASPPDAQPAATPAGAAIEVEQRSEVAAIAGGEPEAVERRPLDDDELALLTALAPLVETPREAKRLVNLYRMIRATRDLSAAASFLGDKRAGQPGEYEAVVILLGLLSAHGRLLADVLSAPPGGRAAPDTLGGLRHRDPASTWSDFVAGIEPQEDGGGHRNAVVGPLDPAAVPAWRTLHAGLADTIELVALPDLTTFQAWAPRIARFSFLLSPLGAAD